MTRLRVGAYVTRWIGGVVPQWIKITEINETEIVCGPWKFDRLTGEEIDDEIDVLVSHLDLESVK